ncbi:MAG TPA: zinc ribbon domain-containing protein [Firmicutes bacterium]|nr:zinc ribbon domain-containing protein [Bacillota bacterium]
MRPAQVHGLGAGCRAQPFPRRFVPCAGGKKYWNEAKGLCKESAPDLGVEMATAQASRTVEEIWARSQIGEEDREMLKEKSWRAGVRATCPDGGLPLNASIKFCPECGAKIASEAHCTGCGAKLSPGAKFYPECGAKVGNPK